MVRLGFSLETKYELPLDQLIPLLRENGFSAVSPVWTPELDLEELDSLVKTHSMQLQSLHAPHKNIAKLWEPGTKEASLVQENIRTCLQDCQKFDIPIMVIHCWQGHNYTFQETALDFRLWDELVEYAAQVGISMAFENLEGAEYLGAILNRYRDQKHIGFCFDSGHDLCYPHKEDFLNLYGNRLLMTHLNDNRGLRDPGGTPSKYDDLHLLPGDGNLDWQVVIARLAAQPYQAVLNFELKKTAKSPNPEDQLYRNHSLKNYLSEAGIRGWKIAQLYDIMAKER